MPSCAEDIGTNARARTLRQSLRFTAIAAVLAVAGAGVSVPGLPGTGAAPAFARDVQTHVHHAQQAVPFLQASVERLPDNTSYRIAWNAAPGAGKVRVYQGNFLGKVTTGSPVAIAGAGVSNVTVASIAGGGRAYFTLVPEHGAPLVVADRGLGLTTIPNLRDLGGYRAADGQWVRLGMIYRADQMDKVSDADLGALTALSTSVVIDLRTKSERSREPDRLPAGARHLVLDVAADATGSIGGDMKDAFAQIAAGKGVEMLTQANRDFVSLESARTSYSAMIRELLSSDGAVVFHCTAGKDRTGWGTALILTMLGVSRETVMADYMLSNHYLREKNAKMLAYFKTTGASFDPAFLEAVVTVRPEFLQAAFDEVDRRYGSFDAYLHDGLGLTPAEITAFRRKFLTGTTS